MEKLLNYLVGNLIDNKDKFTIKKSEDNGIVVFTIQVLKEDMGKIIGKEGKIINSIRNLIKILAVKEEKRVTVELSEPQLTESL